MRTTYVVWPLLALGFLGFSGCDSGFSSEELQQLQTLGPLETSDLPPSPTNQFADSIDAARLGQTLFFDRRMSRDGEVACVSCHDPDRNFSDPRPVSVGVEGRRGRRHAMGIVGAGFQPFFFWDGRTDSLWSQPLKAIESTAEMDFTRVEVAHFIADHYKTSYEALFEPMPDLSSLPDRTRPGGDLWDAMSVEEQDAVNRVFANVGKALEAYQRQLVCSDTRFDRFLRGEVELSRSEVEGAQLFLASGCTNCHSGLMLSDQRFHNTGIGSNGGQADTGREGVYEALLDDPFNGTGVYSDDTQAGAAKLAAIQDETQTMGAFKTPTLRGVGQRSRLGHRGHFDNLTDFIRALYVKPEMESSAVGELDTELEAINWDGVSGGTRGDVEPLVDFLRTLNCPPVHPDLVGPALP